MKIECTGFIRCSVPCELLSLGFQSFCAIEKAYRSLNTALVSLFTKLQIDPHLLICLHRFPAAFSILQFSSSLPASSKLSSALNLSSSSTLHLPASFLFALLPMCCRQFLSILLVLASAPAILCFVVLILCSVEPSLRFFFLHLQNRKEKHNTKWIGNSVGPSCIYTPFLHTIRHLCNRSPLPAVIFLHSCRIDLASGFISASCLRSTLRVQASRPTSRSAISYNKSNACKFSSRIHKRS